MEFHSEYLDDLGIVLSTAIGEMTQDDLLAMARAGMALAAKHHTSKVLLDHRRMIPVLSVVEILRTPEKLQALGLTQTLRVATLYSPDNPRIKDFEFYDNVAFLQGLSHALFVDYDAALRWLMREESQ